MQVSDNNVNKANLRPQEIRILVGFDCSSYPK